MGSGVIGVTTAYFLSRRGHEVTVLDRQDGPGLETSFANGALLTPSMSEPWNAPGCWRALLCSLVRPHSAMQVRLKALPTLAGWGIQFLRNSSCARFERNTQSNLRLALNSLDVLESLRRQTDIDYARTARGSLRLFRDAAALERALADAATRVREGLRFRSLSASDVVAFEPALAPISDVLAGGIHYEADQAGDAYLFCVRMKELAERQGVQFRFRTKVHALSARSGQLVEIATEQQRFVADRCVIAAGSHSVALLRGVGIQLPVRPVKGYSITVSRPLGERGLQTAIVDDHFHAVLTPLGQDIRVAGTAEFAGFDHSMRPERIGNLMRLLRAVLPRAQFDSEAVKPWCGLRAMSADGVPIIGSTPMANVFVNTGHGHLGWTMAAGSAQLIANLVCGEPPSIDPAPFASERFLGLR